MHRRRRLSALSTIILLLQLLGIGTVVLRAAAAEPDCGSATTTSATDDMAGMNMPEAPPAPEDHEPQAPCGLPWALGCTSAAACLPTFILPARSSTAGLSAVESRVAIGDFALPESLTLAPELPPPRG